MKPNKETMILLTILLFSALPAKTFEIADMGNMILENGKSMRCLVEVRTYGKPNQDSSNIVIMPTAFGQTTKDIERLVAPGKLADSTQFFVILMGAFGNSISSSPSNIGDNGGLLPGFTINDMVRAQHMVLTDYLKIKRIYAVIGGSMGGMQAFEWAASFPDMVEKAVIYVSTPALSFPDILYLTSTKEIIETGWAGKQKDAEISKSIALIQALHARTSGFWARSVPETDTEIQMKKIQASFSERFNSKDYYSQLTAILSHDITGDFNGSLEKTAERIKAQMLIIVSDQDQSLNPEPSKKIAALLNAELLILDNDCGHYAPSCDKERFYGTINRFLLDK